MDASTPLTVVGIGADGWPGLDPVRRAAVRDADTVLGAPRHLDLLPDDLPGRRLPWPSPLRDGLPALLSGLPEGRVVALASGDPLFFGVATMLVEILGPEAVRVLPGPSSVTLARARMRWSAEDTTVLRDPRLVVRHLRPDVRLVVLSADETTPAAVARDLVEAGFGASELTVLADLGSTAESVRRGVAASWGAPDVPRLNLLAVRVVGSGGRVLPHAPGLPDDAFEHDGQITKRDVRASALARLEPGPGVLWDVGAGAGSVGIEWARHDPAARTVAIEARAERAERVARNAAALGVPDLEVVVGRAPEALAGLPAPDAVFVGGGATGDGVLDACWDALSPGGRLVVHGVTLETESLLVDRHAALGGELTRLHVEQAATLGAFTGWSPSRAVVQWAVTKELMA